MEAPGTFGYRCRALIGSLLVAVLLMPVSSSAGAAIDRSGLPSHPSAQRPSSDLCKATSSADTTVPYAEFKTTPNGPSVPILLDEYDPDLAPGVRAPAVVLVHGGGWIRGCRRLFDTVAQAMARAGYIVFTIDYRLACSGYEPRYSPQVLAMCGWYYQRPAVETGLPGAAAQDVQDAIAWVRSHAADYWAWNGRIGAIGESAGGTVLLQAIATTSNPARRPDVAGTWSAKLKMGSFITPPDDGIPSADTCDHSHKVDPTFSGMRKCWTGEDFFLNSLDYSATPPDPPVPVCGFPIDPVHSKACAAAGDWIDAAPYTQWRAASRSSLPPVFFSNGGGPDPDIHASAETVPLQEALEFGDLLRAKGFVQGVDMDLCVVNSDLHGVGYVFDPALNCEDHPRGLVFTSTLTFLDRFTRP